MYIYFLEPVTEDGDGPLDMKMSLISDHYYRCVIAMNDLIFSPMVSDFDGLAVARSNKSHINFE